MGKFFSNNTKCCKLGHFFINFCQAFGGGGPGPPPWNRLCQIGEGHGGGPGWGRGGGPQWGQEGQGLEGRGAACVPWSF